MPKDIVFPDDHFLIVISDCGPYVNGQWKLATSLIAEVMNCSSRTVVKRLRVLEDKGFVSPKKENNEWNWWLSMNGVSRTAYYGYRNDVIELEKRIEKFKREIVKVREDRHKLRIQKQVDLYEQHSHVKIDNKSGGGTMGDKLKKKRINLFPRLDDLDDGNMNVKSEIELPELDENFDIIEE